MAKKIFIAATLQNVGKTTFSLGLIASMKKIFKRIGFIKPIGQRYLMEQGYKVDEDSILIDKVFHVGRDLKIKDLSPIAVERGFTEKYIEGTAKKDYGDKILQSYKRVAKDNELVIIEGTGHAGVGSVFDLSNATVAKLLGSKVILIAPGGVGRPIDEVMLNKAVFDAIGVEIAGIIVNKVKPEKYDKINRIVRLGFKRKNIPVLGVMPYQRKLALPSMREITEEFDVQVLAGRDNLDTPVDKILVGAMDVKHALKYVQHNTLLITPAERIDLLNAVVMIQSLQKGQSENKFSGVVLTGDVDPNPKILQCLDELKLPAIAIKTDTYSASHMIDKILVKVKPGDTDKIGLIVEMVEKYVDIDMIIKNLT